LSFSFIDFELRYAKAAVKLGTAAQAMAKGALFSCRAFRPDFIAYVCNNARKLLQSSFFQLEIIHKGSGA